MKTRHLLTFCAVIAIATVAGFVALKQLGRPGVDTVRSPLADSGDASPSPVGGGAPSVASTLPTAPAKPAEAPPATADAAPEPEPAAASQATTDEIWTERLSSLLNNDSYSDLELGNKLAAIAADGNVPEWARAQAMANALLFTDDANYERDMKLLALRTDLPETVNDVVLDDLINRDPEVILPVARQFVAAPGHPLAGAIEEFVKSVEEQIAGAN
ncbi:MAG: hypothetical protein JNK37_13905 [Verrucomicrobiales bacterium]|nr:hypothetical protein [Verrucomicrobiales bacterium]